MNSITAASHAEGTWLESHMEVKNISEEVLCTLTGSLTQAESRQYKFKIDHNLFFQIPENYPIIPRSTEMELMRTLSHKNR
jgi:hypothetical protein